MRFWVWERLMDFAPWAFLVVTFVAWWATPVAIHAVLRRVEARWRENLAGSSWRHALVRGHLLVLVVIFVGLGVLALVLRVKHVSMPIHESVVALIAMTLAVATMRFAARVIVEHAATLAIWATISWYLISFARHSYTSGGRWALVPAAGLLSFAVVSAVTEFAARRIALPAPTRRVKIATQVVYCVGMLGGIALDTWFVTVMRLPVAFGAVLIVVPAACAAVRIWQLATWDAATYGFHAPMATQRRVTRFTFGASVSTAVLLWAAIVVHAIPGVSEGILDSGFRP